MEFALIYEKFSETIDFIGGSNGGAKPPDAEKWVFLSRRLIFRVGGENIIK